MQTENAQLVARLRPIFLVVQRVRQHRPVQHEDPAHAGAVGDANPYLDPFPATQIDACIALGGDMVEIDVTATADGAVVLMRSETVDRKTDGPAASPT